ncbi:UxaA family hydrolase [Budvicia aquatica]|uniref:D-galactarate dehydratase / Altronate hydrolase, C terminus n=1 Tax=Budvicia aquatica TaxID=82979 RepID=A0A484ZMI8_9GAMM|nr:UxaA family hydrolase [Budvicia aquatica]VFS49654.1 D-galactarate dehydratase / Altronate hydrolase, C terminus [Budvicia aquatica]
MSTSISQRLLSLCHKYRIVTFSSIVRNNGLVGIRNELWIIPTLGCVNGIARQIQQRFLKENNGAEDIDGVHLFSHPFGCSQLGEDHETPEQCCKIWYVTQRRSRYWLSDFGCENNQVDAFRETMGGSR